MAFVTECLITPSGYSSRVCSLWAREWRWHWNSTHGPWDTGSTVNGKYRYLFGTVLVQAESIVNDMKDNYKNGGADYTGKTVSVPYTITLVPSGTGCPGAGCSDAIIAAELGGNPTGKSVYAYPTTGRCQPVLEPVGGEVCSVFCKSQYLLAYCC